MFQLHFARDTGRFGDVNTVMINVDSSALICVIIALGMGVAFLVADVRSQTTRMLSAFLMSIGAAIFLNVTYVRPYPTDALPALSYLAPWATAVSIVFGAEWVLRIRRMVPAGTLKTRFGDLQFRMAQGFALVYAALGMVFNDLRAEYFLGALGRTGLFPQWEFWLFASPFLLAVLCVVDGTLITLNRKPDHAEVVRLGGVAVAAPMIAAGLLLPPPWASYSSALGLMVFLIAAVQYHVLQGQRGQFLRRFLSPSVAELVRRDGLARAMQQQKLPVAAVACDLRGYTDFASNRDSAEVIAVLQDFYDQVGIEAAAHGATIKDYAGDGVLLLLGAPLPMDGHARQAVHMAACIRRRCEQLFAQRGIELGIGVGVASGLVSVGVIGQQRLEYVAVGRSVNLAARLCQNAASGEILCDDDTLAQVEDRGRFVSGERMQLKGFVDPVQTWLLPAF